MPPELAESVNLFALRHGISQSEAIRRLTSIALAFLPHYDAIKNVAQAAIATDDGKMATEEHAEVANAFMALDDLIQG